MNLKKKKKLSILSEFFPLEKKNEKRRKQTLEVVVKIFFETNNYYKNINPILKRF